MTSQNSDRLVWIDLEMTGLNPDFDRIIEIATVITDHDLEVIAEGPVLAIHQSDEMLAGMDAICLSSEKIAAFLVPVMLTEPINGSRVR